MSTPAIVVLGTPRSGISVASECFRILGLKSCSFGGQGSSVSASYIHRELVQELGLSLPIFGSLPQGWEESQGARRAKERIQNLIVSQNESDCPYFYADRYLCRFFSLWSEVFKSEKMDPRVLLLVRHPWETSLSVCCKEKLDQPTAFLLWLTDIHEGLCACHENPYCLTTYDQLVADPVLTLMRIGRELDFLWPLAPQTASEGLLNFVQPRLRKFHVGQYPFGDHQKYYSIKLLYDRMQRDYSLFKKNKFQSEKNGDRLTTSFQQDMVDGVLQISGEIIENNQKYIDHFQRAASVNVSKLFMQVAFRFTDETEKEVKTFPLLENEWQTILIKVPCAGRGESCRIQISPLSTNGVVHLALIQIYNTISDQSYICLETPEQFDAIKIKQFAIACANQKNFVLIITNKDAVIELPNLKMQRHCAATMKIMIKVSRDQAILEQALCRKLKGQGTTTADIEASFQKKLLEVSNSWDFCHTLMKKIAVFKELSAKQQTALMKTKTFWGKDIYIHPGEDVSSNIFYFGYFDLNLTTFFSDFVWEGATVIDVGAHIGFFTMLAAELVGNSGRVISLEPTPETVSILQKNVQNYSCVTIIPKLAWSSQRIVNFSKFNPIFSAYNTAASARVQRANSNTLEETVIQIDAITIDSMVEEHNLKPDLIKIDVENAERHVLDGMKKVISQDRPVIVLEVGDDTNENFETTPCSHEIVMTVIQYDYIAIESVAGRYKEHQICDFYSYNNIILVPREMMPIRRPLGAIVVQKGCFF